jgi:DNA-binding NarL/FixJ family response regulator
LSIFPIPPLRTPRHRRPLTRLDDRLARGNLTAREQEVALLVASGRTNRQIANRLRVSERTVETHLGNVYRKVGVSSRVMLAMLLIRDQQADG